MRVVESKEFSQPQGHKDTRVACLFLFPSLMKGDGYEWITA